jgi:hypothetical protein
MSAENPTPAEQALRQDVIAKIGELVLEEMVFAANAIKEERNAPSPAAHGLRFNQRSGRPV